jgi:alkyl sulfatase BDS1-like metallo-beta-lactamase superfamily hydrolase
MWLRIGSTAQSLFGVDVLMHLTCHLPVDSIKRVLENAKKAGIRNILALRGDPIINDARGWVPAVCNHIVLFPKQLEFFFFAHEFLFYKPSQHCPPVISNVFLFFCTLLV